MSDEKKTGKSYAVSRHYNYDSHPQNPNYAGMAQADWVQMIKEMLDGIAKASEVEYLAYIFHDRDIDKDGGMKPIHCHVFVRFKQSMEQEVVARAFGTTDRMKNCEPINNHLGAAKYMIHISDSALKEEKTIYSPNEVVCFNCRYRDMIKADFWGKAKNEQYENKLLDKKAVERLVVDLALKIRNGELRKDEALEQLEQQAGYYWVRQHRNSFNDDQQGHIERRIKVMSEKGRNNRNIYIMGSGGIGKSNLGRKLGVRLAGGKGFLPTAPLGKGKTPDALNLYRDEAVVMFNEISPQGWTLDEFLACFDMYEYAPFPSRNENKHFIGHTSIFTNSISPLRFAKDLLIYSKGGKQYQDSANKQEINSEVSTLDKYWQARRRFNSMILLLEDENDAELVHGHVFNLRYDKYRKDANGKTVPVEGAHILVGSFSFRNEIGKAPEITDNILEQVIELLAIDTTDRFTNEKTISEFMDEHGLNETMRDDMLSAFIDEVVNECVWDLLPTNFLYAIYRKYRDAFYPKDDLLSIQEFTGSMRTLLDGWEWKKDVRSSGKMTKREPLVWDYKLEDWGYAVQAYPTFTPKPKYSGFVRK